MIKNQVRVIDLFFRSGIIYWETIPIFVLLAIVVYICIFLLSSGHFLNILFFLIFLIFIINLSTLKGFGKIMAIILGHRTPFFDDCRWMPMCRWITMATVRTCRSADLRNMSPQNPADGPILPILPTQAASGGPKLSAGQQDRHYLCPLPPQDPCPLITPPMGRFCRSADSLGSPRFPQGLQRLLRSAESALDHRPSKKEVRWIGLLAIQCPALRHSLLGSLIMSKLRYCLCLDHQGSIPKAVAWLRCYHAMQERVLKRQALSWSQNQRMLNRGGSQILCRCFTTYQ